MEQNQRAGRALEARLRNAALGLVVAVATVVLVAQASGSGTATAHTPASSTPQCPPNDLIVHVHNVRAPTGGRSSTAGAALARELRTEYPGLSSGAFSPGRVTRDSVELVARERGKRVASVLIVRDGEGWIVDGLTACNSFLATRGGAR